MKITYTSPDGRTWDTESDCLGWEKLQHLLDAAHRADRAAEDEPESQFEDFLAQSLQADFSYDYKGQDLWRNRHHLYRLVDLMRQAEAGG